MGGPNKKYPHRINEKIKAPMVRVIDADGKQIGIMPTNKAIELAYSMGLDLVEVSPNADPPVAKIMDYGKFLYMEKKLRREARKEERLQGRKKLSGEIKEIELRPNINVHDLAIKTRKIEEFLEEGHKVKIRVVFRGREIIHAHKGREILDAVIEQLRDKSVIEVNPKMENNMIYTILRPIFK